MVPTQDVTLTGKAMARTSPHGYIGRLYWLADDLCSELRLGINVMSRITFV